MNDSEKYCEGKAEKVASQSIEIAIK